MADHILEGTTVKVRARVAKGTAKTDTFKFVFFKDGAEFKQEQAQFPEVREESSSTDKRELTEKGWVEAILAAPDVDDEKESYVLSYKIIHGEEEKTDFPTFTVWPRKGKLKVEDAKNGGD